MDNMIGGTSEMEVGKTYNIDGACFGKYQGDVLVKGNFPPYSGMLHLVTKEWSDTRIVAVFKDDTRGVFREKATLSIKAFGGQEGFPVDIDFRPKLEKDWLLTGRTPLTIVCSTASNADDCHNQAADFVEASHASIGGRTAWGTDLWQFRLKNQWFVSSVDAIHIDSLGGVLAWPKPHSYDPKTDLWSVPIGWEIASAGRIQYRYRIVVSGPAGTKYY
jgi:hypothetical protein